MPEEKNSVERLTLLRACKAQEGILCGISSGALLHAGCLVASELGRSKRLLAILADTGERHLSTELWS
jgi:cysteine synthase A